jgi:hypothetical protein
MHRKCEIGHDVGGVLSVLAKIGGFWPKTGMVLAFYA